MLKPLEPWETIDAVKAARGLNLKSQACLEEMIDWGAWESREALIGAWATAHGTETTRALAADYSVAYLDENNRALLNELIRRSRTMEEALASAMESTVLHYQSTGMKESTWSEETVAHAGHIKHSVSSHLGPPMSIFNVLEQLREKDVNDVLKKPEEEIVRSGNH